MLVGGGHTHALLLRMLGMAQVAGVRVTLVADTAAAAYSGMLPGRVGGYYDDDEMQIDLRRLCGFAGAQFIQGQVTGLDLSAKRVSIEGRPAVGYDVLSLNTGIRSGVSGVRGAERFGVPVKPIDGFLRVWDRLAALPGTSQIVIVGAGAGGVELSFNMRRRLPAAPITVVDFSPTVTPTHALETQRFLAEELGRKNIALRLDARVDSVSAGALTLASGDTIPYTHLFWSTPGTPAPWLKTSGLAVDEAGFVIVDATLTSVSHPGVFAAGDIAAIKDAPRPRSGVFAVRQAKPLAENLRRHIAGQPLTAYHPQRRYLSLIGLGDGRAVASRGAVAWRGAWVWRLKDRIDRKFMDQFAGLELPSSAFADAAEPGSTVALKARAAIRCSGCAAKVGADVLSGALARLQAPDGGAASSSPAGGPAGADVLIGLAEADDAAVVAVPAGQALVQSVDFLPSMVSDPYVFGRIAAAHAVSDLLAMGATPHSAQAMVNVPFALPAKSEELIYQLLGGVRAALGDAGATLIGGHTAEAKELALGLAVNGLVAPALALRKGGLQPGQELVLTKALGTGVILAAEMRLAAKGRWLDGAIASMLQLNTAAARVLRQHGATACTDVTGFGLAGHLVEMARASACRCRIDLRAVPLLDGALELTSAGIRSTLYAQNAAMAAPIISPERSKDPALPLIFDPQTSGGLLAGVPAGTGAACVAALRVAGCMAAVIGLVEDPIVPPTKPGEDWLRVV